jgi:hypothetical protein
MSLEERIENLTERLVPEPPGMLAIVMFALNVQAHGETDAAATSLECHTVGRHAVAFLVGGSEKERRTELKRLRASGEYDRDPFAWTPPAITEGDAVDIALNSR